jgi:hypothetical protein
VPTIARPRALAEMPWRAANCYAKSHSPRVDEVRLRRLRELGLEERVELEDPFGGNLLVAIARRPSVSRAS